MARGKLKITKEIQGKGMQCSNESSKRSNEVDDHCDRCSECVKRSEANDRASRLPKLNYQILLAKENLVL